MRKSATIMAAVAACALFLAACSEDKLETREDVIAQIQKEDPSIDGAMAGCLADGMIATFGYDTLNEDRDPTAEEDDQMGDIVLDCLDSGVGGEGDEAVDPSEVDCSVMPDDASRQACEDDMSELDDMMDEIDEEMGEMDEDMDSSG